VSQRAHDGREAVAHADNGAFDVVVSDVNMPDLDGLSLLRAIRVRRPQRDSKGHEDL
jgi:two-component system chemotaxis response regulator CheY